MRRPIPRTRGSIYLRRCLVCHGEKSNDRSRAAGSLAVAPRDFTSEDARGRLTREYMITIVREGRPDTPMIARKMQMTQAEIEAAVDYVRLTFLQEPPKPARSAANPVSAFHRPEVRP